MTSSLDFASGHYFSNEKPLNYFLLVENGCFWHQTLSMLCKIHTAQNIDILPNFLVWKLCRKCAFAQILNTRKLGKIHPDGIYLLKVNNKNSRTWCEISSKLTIKTQERRQWRRNGFAPVFFVLTLNIFHTLF